MDSMLSWICLLLAGGAEIVGVFVMKKFILTNKKIFLVGIALLFMLSLYFLSIAMHSIAMATAYAIWTGIGACGGVMVGILFFHEDKSLSKLFFIVLILGSSIGLKALDGA